MGESPSPDPTPAPPELIAQVPAGVWTEIAGQLDHWEDLAALAETSEGGLDAVRAVPDIAVVFTPTELTAALADPTKRFILLLKDGLTINAASANEHTLVGTRRANMTVTGDGVLYLLGPEASATVTGGQAYAHDHATIETVTGGAGYAYDTATIHTVTRGEAYVYAFGAATIHTVNGGEVYAYDTATIENVTGGHAAARGRTTVTVADGGTVTAYGNAHIINNGGTVHIGEGFTGTITGPNHTTPLTPVTEDDAIDMNFDQDFND